MNPTTSLPRKQRTLDVRAMIARGEEPFVKIMQTVAALAPDEELVLITPFLSSPMIERFSPRDFRRNRSAATTADGRPTFPASKNPRDKPRGIEGKLQERPYAAIARNLAA